MQLSEKEIVEAALSLEYSVDVKVLSNNPGEITRTITLTKTYKVEQPCKQ